MCLRHWPLDERNRSQLQKINKVIMKIKQKLLFAIQYKSDAKSKNSIKCFLKIYVIDQIINIAKRHPKINFWPSRKN